VSPVPTLEPNGPIDGRLSSGKAPGFFDRNTELPPEIIQGVIREKQLGAFAGPFGMGKSPLLNDIELHVIYGIPWCGRAVQKRPVIHFDMETSGPVYKSNLRNIAARLGVPVPDVPEQLEPFLEQDDPIREPNTKKLLAALREDKLDNRFLLIEEALEKKPNALVLIDPLELLFRIDTGKKQHVLYLYSHLRQQILSKFPHAAIITTFNLRKFGGDFRPKLLTEPRKWLEEVCGTLDILNRSDVRLGIDTHDDDVKVINGIRRGEELHPLLVRPVGEAPRLAGFEACALDSASLAAVLPPKQFIYWNGLPRRFRFDDVADSIVPHSSLGRLLSRAQSLGLIEQNAAGYWEKR